MKKMFMFGLLAGLLTFSASGVSAAEVPLPDLTDVDTSLAVESTENTMNTAGTMVYPDSYPAGYYSYTTESTVDAAGCYEMFEKVNALRVSTGKKPLTLDADLVRAAMYRASEINLVYRHKDPAGGWGQPDYTFIGGTENIVIGRTSGLAAYQAFEGSGGHYMQMTASDDTRVGVGNYGGGWVLCFGGDNRKGADMTKEQLIAQYASGGKVIRTVIDQTTTDENRYDGTNSCYTPHACVDGSYAQTKGITLDNGVSQQLNAYVAPDPFDPSYPNLEVKIVPSTIPWSSSNPSVASVDSNGVVNGKTAGLAIISAKVGPTTLTYNVTVSNSGTTPTEIDPNYLVKYRTHVQNVGWQAFVADGSMSGTSGRSLRLEGINIDLNDNVSGGIEYRTHVQNIGWQNYVANGAMSGTEGMSYRLEGIQIRLTGEAATKYDIYYRVHTQNIGWMGWAKNGEQSGSAGYSYRLEGIEIKVVPKGSGAPGSTVNAFVEKK